MAHSSEHLLGEKLYGDDFTLEEIHMWYEDEKEGYARLGAENKSTYRYAYHALNFLHGFRQLLTKQYTNVLGLGSAYGEEFLPIIHSIQRLTIIDPSDAFYSREIHGVPCTFLRPSLDGRIPNDDCSFDLILCLGVLHHIPNVTAVVNEMYRTLTHGGDALIREPITSMGDWSKVRPGLTKRERGIPAKLLDRIIVESGFKIRHRSYCIFGAIPKACVRMGVAAYNNTFITWLDAQVSRLLSWNDHYDRRRLFQKFAPSGIYYVVRKD